MVDWKAKQPRNERDKHADISPTNIPSTQGKAVAVSCPFYLTMMTDDIATKNHTVEVSDIAELMMDEST